MIFFKICFMLLTLGLVNLAKKLRILFKIGLILSLCIPYCSNGKEPEDQSHCKSESRVILNLFYEPALHSNALQSPHHTQPNAPVSYKNPIKPTVAEMLAYLHKFCKQLYLAKLTTGILTLALYCWIIKKRFFHDFSTVAFA